MSVYIFCITSCLFLLRIVPATGENVTDTLSSDNGPSVIPEVKPASLLPCSVLKERRNPNFRYKYTHADIKGLMCRCHGHCDNISDAIPSHVKDSIHHYRYHPLSSLNRGQFILVVTVLSVILLLGIIGNVWAIVKLSKRMRQSCQTFTFIIALCCSDLLVLCVCLPIKVIEHFRLGDIFSEPTCKISYYLRDFTLTWSVFTLTIISIERYFAICRPTDVLYRCTWQHAKRIIVGTVVISLWLALPSPFIVKFYQPAGRRYMECLQQSESDEYLILYFIFYQTVLFTVPCVTMVVMYVKTCRTLWHATSINIQLQEPERASTEQDDRANLCVQDTVQSRKRMIFVLVLVVAVFVLCWGPSLLVQLLCALNVIQYNRDKFRLAFDTMIYVSCALNPFLFVGMTPGLYDQLLECLWKFRRPELTNIQPEETVARETRQTI